MSKIIAFVREPALSLEKCVTSQKGVFPNAILARKQWRKYIDALSSVCFKIVHLSVLESHPEYLYYNLIILIVVLCLWKTRVFALDEGPLLQIWVIHHVEEKNYPCSFLSNWKILNVFKWVLNARWTAAMSCLRESTCLLVKANAQMRLVSSFCKMYFPSQRLY